jgi:hypothetical protein
LNFDWNNSIIVEENPTKDTIQYWITDTLVSHLDTLSIEMTYYATDTLGNMALNTDTLFLNPKKTLDKILKEKQKKLDDWEKEQKRKERRGQPFDSIPPVEKLSVRITPSGNVDPDASIKIAFEEPLARLDTAGIHLMLKKDTVWNEVPYYFDLQPGKLYKYELIGEWRPEQEYKLVLDSACIEGIYGTVNDPQEVSLKVPSMDSYSALFVNVKGLEGPVIVQLLNKDVPYKEALVENGHADFYFVKPGTYYLRCFEDSNDDGKWTTGEYASKLHPERVFYYPGELDLKAKFDITQDWNVLSTSLDKQKPEAITTQKPDKEKSIKNRNAERERQMNRNKNND